MISLNYRDSRPIYEQIKDGLRKLVVSGAILPGEKLPSVRELASDLAINPNTIQRAYRELENEQYIYTVAGRGSFAAPGWDVNTARGEALLRQFDEVAAELLYTGQTRDALKGRIDKIGHREEKEKDD
ncbi:GntR family transcriptional regulator [Sporobacter termitidis DSM 10068]|uniref:GntR family transcriptional regulator n=1 Tax=Sporobacter termitidis DSM 10068 TaxID=1123282 RepID=A0A1M5Y7V4_9FIRM|nr:GntR family transcriptional regulator [Sporobacter termitidis]SHI07904.1 GntR family transcriptional regulator [Sporobacter termitidis DSM 10068]